MAVNLGSTYHMNVLAENGALCQIRFTLMKNEFTLMLDTSGTGLHKRGYRAESNSAPIRETLAAGIVDIARIRDGDRVCDPFCGSGTLLIEAAMKALDIAPGLSRTFAGEHMSFLPKSVWDSAREEAKSRIGNSSDFRAEGFDIDLQCVKLTLQNARKAGVGECVTAKTRNIRDFTYPEYPIKILTNPPYGERMLEVSDAREIYKVLGERLIPFNGSSLYIITPDEDFENIFGVNADKNRKLYNGMMMCRLYTYYK